MSLYLDPAVLERLETHDPSEALDEGNLADCWTVLEGVSHFLCVVHNAAHDRQGQFASAVADPIETWP